MKIIYYLAIMLLIFGCASVEEREAQLSNGTNATDIAGNGTGAGIGSNESVSQNETVAENETIQESWKRHSAGDFSFEYPPYMDTDTAKGIFTGVRNIGGQTEEVLIVTNLDALKVYGANAAKVYNENPSRTASDFLDYDMSKDPVDVLQSAYDFSTVRTYAIVRDAEVAEVGFDLRFSGAKTVFHGYALSIYIPEKNEHGKVRILATSQEKADELKDRFLLSFRIG